jgi:hypothetical protein
MLTLERIDPERAPWERMDRLPDRVVFQTREWLSFIEETQGAEPVVAVLADGSTTVGYFTGLMTRRYGVRILGSPMAGWSTWYMGFNLLEGVPRGEALRALTPFAFDALGCIHVEIGDREMRVTDLDGAEFGQTIARRLLVDLSRTEDEVWSSMTSACRRCIRKADKSGVVIEEASELEFADEYFEQLQDVFAKQSLVPMYTADRVRKLIAHLHPTGRLLLLRARDSEGRSIATGLFPAMNRTAYFWGGASWREHQHLRPNESLMWYALRYWRARGVELCDLGGHFPYKLKYAPTEVSIPFVHKSRYRVLWPLRNLAAGAFEYRQRLLGRLSRRDA